MITLTLSVPNITQVLAAGYTTLELTKSASQQQYGNDYAPIAGASVALSTGVTSYSLTDISGSPGDWYAALYLQAGGTNPSAPGSPMPGYLSDLCNATRDLLGVTTAEVSDTQVQGYAYLPTALAHVRQRLSTFDSVVAAGGDLGSLALGALAHYVAYLLCQRMKTIVVDMEQFKDYRYQRNRIMDWDATAQSLLERFEVMVSQAAQETPDDVNVMEDGAFILSGPTRGGQDTSGGLVPMDPSSGYGTPAQYDSAGNYIGPGGGGV